MTLRNRSGYYAMTPNTIERIDLTNDVPVFSLPVRSRDAVTLTADVPRASTENSHGYAPNSFSIDLTQDIEEFDNLRDATPRELADYQQSARALQTPSFRAPVDNVTAPQLGVDLSLGMCVEFRDGDFVRIQRVSTYNLWGTLFRRAYLIDHKLEKKLNEVCALITAPEGAEDPGIGDYQVKRRIEDVIAVRELVVTNSDFPNLSFRDVDEPYSCAEEAAWDCGRLVCRRVHTNFLGWRSGKLTTVEETFVRPSKHECTRGAGVPHYVLREAWRGNEVRKASKVEARSASVTTTTTQPRIPTYFAVRKESKRQRDEMIDLTKHLEDEELEEISTIVTQTYKRIKRDSVFESTTNNVYTQRFKKPTSATNTATVEVDLSFADICSGCGGTVRAAFELGLDMKYLLDKWGDACKTLNDNWPEKTIYHMDIFEFLKLKGDFRVDLLHISFPCQVFSPAHTQEGKNDEANIATNLSAFELIKKIRPRVVTFEQTSGLITHHKLYYGAMLHQITSCGYNLRSKVLTCDTLGNCQARKRLFIIASCPGEALPRFPEATHGRNRPGLKPLVTINDRLRKLRGRETEAHMRHSIPRDERPYDGNKPLKGCITTSGGESDLHPNGRRTFTLQELASLQGLPPTHRFHSRLGRSSIKTQIGNAVPVCVAKAVFKQCVKTMKKTDAAIAAEKAEVVTVDD